MKSSPKRIRVSVMAIAFSLSSFLIPCDSGADDAAGEDQERYEIRLKSRHFTPPESRDQLVGAMAVDTKTQNRMHVFMQFKTHPDSESRGQLSELGVALLKYLPKNTWFASIPIGLATDHAALSAVRWIGCIMPEDKLSPSILDAVAGDGAHVENGKISLMVKYFSDIDAQALRYRMEDLSAVVLSESSLLNAFSISIDRESIISIAKDDAVQWIEPAEYAPQMESDRVRYHSQVDLAHNIWGLTGKDIRVGVFEDGHVFAVHPDFDTRVARPDLGNGDIPSWHATNVAGMISGSGSQSQEEFGTPLQWRGMAPDAEIYSYSFAEDNSTGYTNDVAHAVLFFNIDIANNSWGFSSCDTYGTYTEYCSFLDDVVHGGHTAPFGGALPVIFSAGNDRDGFGASNNLECAVFNEKSAPFANYGTINQPKAAKNIITVGAVDSLDNAMTIYSSWGPTTDGRLKPDIVASGHHGGTLLNGVSKEASNNCRLGGSSYITPTYNYGFPFTGTHTGGDESPYLEYNSDIYGTYETDELIGFTLINIDSGQSCIISRQSASGTVLCQNGQDITWNTGDSFTIDRQYGCFGQTSNSAAVTSGAIALLLEYFDNNDQHQRLSSTIKALLIHSALDLNDSNNSWYNKGPDYASGYGLLRIHDTIVMFSLRGFVEQKILFRQTTPQQMHYLFNVSVDAPIVRVTLAWDDEPGTENATDALISDLDLILRDPEGGIHYPWTLDPDNPSAPAVRTKSDHVNNVEQVLVDTNIIPGMWEAIVIGTDINDSDGYQKFSIVGQKFTPGLSYYLTRNLRLDRPYTGGTSTLFESNVMYYGSSTPCLNGPEVVHEITTNCAGDLRVSLTGTTSNLWVILLSDLDPRNPLDCTSSYHQYPFAEYLDAPPGTYYIVVDSPDGQSGPYTLTASLDGCRPLGDFNSDGDSDGVDLSDLVDEFGQTCSRECLTDLNNDGRVDQLDLDLFVPGFGLVDSP